LWDRGIFRERHPMSNGNFQRAINEPK